MCVLAVSVILSFCLAALSCQWDSMANQSGRKAHAAVLSAVQAIAVPVLLLAGMCRGQVAGQGLLFGYDPARGTARLCRVCEEGHVPILAAAVGGSAPKPNVKERSQG